MSFHPYEMVDGVREKSYFRNWWMTTGAVPDASPQVPVRDEKEEIAANSSSILGYAIDISRS
jgi:hypothetical protein